MSGFSPVTLSLLGLVFVVALCLSILAVRRDHPDHVHTLWYVFSLTLCSVSVLFFYIYENSRAIQSTPLGGMAGTIAVTFMKASMDVREEIYILLTAGAFSREKGSRRPSRRSVMSRHHSWARFGEGRTSLYDEITNKIIAELEAGRVPWVQPWGTAAAKAPLAMPKNAVTSRQYGGRKAHD